MIKNFARKMVYNHDFLYNLYIDFFWKFEPGTLDYFLMEFARANPQTRFIQIGANDGFSNDPLYKFVRRYKWHGVLVEPQKKVYEQLVNLHAHPGVSYENSAVGLEVGRGHIYKLSFSDSRWANGLSSFDYKYLKNLLKTRYVKEHAKKEGIDLDQYGKELIQKEGVKILSIEALMEKYGLLSVELMAFDVEGYEAVLIPSINFKRFKPKVVLFEHRHLNEADSKKIFEHLKWHGYSIRKYQNDSVAQLVP